MRRIESAEPEVVSRLNLLRNIFGILFSLLGGLPPFSTVTMLQEAPRVKKGLHCMHWHHNTCPTLTRYRLQAGFHRRSEAATEDVIAAHELLVGKVGGVYARHGRPETRGSRRHRERRRAG